MVFLGGGLASLNTRMESYGRSQISHHMAWSDSNRDKLKLPALLIPGRVYKLTLRPTAMRDKIQRPSPQAQMKDKPQATKIQAPSSRALQTHAGLYQ